MYDLISLPSLPRMHLNVSLPSRLHQSLSCHRRNGLCCPRYTRPSPRKCCLLVWLCINYQRADLGQEAGEGLPPELGTSEFLTCLLPLIGASGKWSDLGIASYLQQHHEEQRQRSKACTVHSDCRGSDIGPSDNEKKASGTGVSCRSNPFHTQS